MDLKTLTTRQLLEIKLGAANVAIFINGLKNMYQIAKYYGDYYEDTAMGNLLNSVFADRR